MNEGETMDFPLCARFGLTGEEIRRRLMMFGIGLDDAKPLTYARDLIRDRADELVEVFYRHLSAFPELSRFVSHENASSRLRAQLHDYLLSLGEAVESQRYIEGRLRVGTVHDKIGVPLKGYLAAYSCLLQNISEMIRSEIKDANKAMAACTAINQIILFDAALAVETYHVAAVDRCEHLISQLEHEQGEIRKLSQTDHLTGVLNRRSFLDDLDAEVQRCGRYGNSLCVLMIDADNFKSINDNYGHHAGDIVLKEIAKVLRATVRQTDKCGRWGGEEFVVALVETRLDTAIVIAERIRLALIRSDIFVEGSRLNVSASIGIARWLPGTEDTTQILRQADAAMYAAKSAGKNCVKVIDHDEVVHLPDAPC